MNYRFPYKEGEVLTKMAFVTYFCFLTASLKSLFILATRSKLEIPMQRSHATGPKGNGCSSEERTCLIYISSYK